MTAAQRCFLRCVLRITDVNVCTDALAAESDTTAGLGTACQSLSLTELAECQLCITPSARFQESSSLCCISSKHASLVRLKITAVAARDSIRHSTDASPTHSRTARRIDASSIAPRSDAIAATPPCCVGEEKARRGRRLRSRGVDDAEDEEEGASAASCAVDASPPLTRRWPRRTRRRRRTSPASLDRGTRTTQTRTRPEHRSAAAR